MRGKGRDALEAQSALDKVKAASAPVIKMAGSLKSDPDTGYDTKFEHAPADPALRKDLGDFFQGTRFGRTEGLIKDFAEGTGFAKSWLAAREQQKPGDKITLYRSRAGGYTGDEHERALSSWTDDKEAADTWLDTGMTADKRGHEGQGKVVTKQVDRRDILAVAMHDNIPGGYFPQGLHEYVVYTPPKK